MKILIISHNPITTQNNMGKTFLSLFSGFDREELCQLYIYPTLPNVDRCGSFYRVTDKQMLVSLVPGRKAGGVIPKEQIRATEGLYEQPKDESLYRNRKNKSPLRRLLRDALWSVGNWYSRDLKAWLDREKPECIFVAPGAAKFIYDFALRISRDRDIPVVTYICDEFYFVQESERPLEKLRLRLFRDKMRSLMDNTAHLVTISEELREAYVREFGVKATTLMTGAGIPAAERVSEEQPCQVCYFGNIRANRYVSLCEIGRELDAINRSGGTDYRLKIYTMEKDAAILEQLRQIKAIELHPFVTGEAFEREFRRAQLLLHVEAFDEESIDRVRHSVSTKIADSLASGIPLLAYGPDRVSSMKHLLRHGCAITATSQDQLHNMLIRAFRDEDARIQAASRGLEVAGTWHDSEKTGLQLRQILEEAIKNKMTQRAKDV